MKSYDYDAIYRSPNYGYPKGSHGRNGQKIIGICLHITGAAWQSNYNWIMNPAANASYNAVVRDDGTVVSLVPEMNAPYSHGRINRATWPLLKSGVNPNLYTLSLARTGANQRTWAPAQLDSTLKVLKAWSKAYDIPLKRPYIFGHFEIDSTGRWYCPGEGFFDRVITALANLEPAETESDPVPTRLWYRVVAGSFRSAEYAAKREKTLNAMGYDTFQAGFRDADENAWIRIIAGCYQDPDLARKHAANMHASGIDTFVIPHRTEGVV